MTRALPALLRPLLLVVAVLGLLGTGGVELVARSGSAPAVSVLGAAGTSAVRGATQRADAQAPGAVLRPPVAPASTPTGGSAALPPPHAPTAPPHLDASPQGRPPTAPALTSAWSSAAGRAPPLTTGT